MQEETLVRIFFTSGRVETRPVANVSFCFLDEMEVAEVTKPRVFEPPRDHLIVMMDKVDAISIHRGTFARKNDNTGRTGSLS